MLLVTRLHGLHFGMTSLMCLEQHRWYLVNSRLLISCGRTSILPCKEAAESLASAIR